MIFTYLVIIQEMNSTASHLLQLKEEELGRKTVLASVTKQWLIQEPVQNNHIFNSFLKEVLEGEVIINPNYDYENFSLNYNDMESKDKNLSLNQWYITPDIKSYDQIDEENRERIKLFQPLFPVLQAILFDSLQPADELYSTIYYIYKEHRMFLQYPAYNNALFYDPIEVNETCPYYNPDMKDIYDGR